MMREVTMGQRQLGQVAGLATIMTFEWWPLVNCADECLNSELESFNHHPVAFVAGVIQQVEDRCRLRARWPALRAPRARPKGLVFVSLLGD